MSRRGAIIRRKKINALWGRGSLFATPDERRSKRKLQPKSSLLDGPDRPHHEGWNMVAHAARLRPPWGLVGPRGLWGLCAVSLPLAPIVVVLALWRGLTMRLGMTLRFGLALMLRGTVRFRSRRVLGTFGSRSLLLFRRNRFLGLLRRKGL